MLTNLPFTTFLPDIFLHQLPLKCTIASIVGIVVHHGIFRKGEWHMKAPNLVKLYFAGCIAIVLLETRLKVEKHGIRSGVLVAGSFTVALFSSMAIYRIFFHRTRHFPGPRLAAVSKLWHMYHCLNGQNHLLLEKLHRQYGDFVRTGPSEITIFHPDALVKLDGPGNKTTKSDWYDFILPHVGVTTIRDRSYHDQRRRVWTKGLSTSDLSRYQEYISAQAQKLEAIIAASANSNVTVNFSTYAYWFSFDVMGLFVLSRSFDMLHQEEWHYSVVTLRRAMRLLGPLSSVPWLGQLGFKFLRGYWVVKDWYTMIEFCASRMQERINGKDSHDIAQWIIADSKKRNAIESDHHLLTGEAIVAIIAGSDTVAPTLVFLFYELALNPEKAEKLYEELRDSDIHDIKILQNLPYLNAVIKETLRLHPAVPTGGYRDTPPGGMTIGGKFIPGNTTVVAPRYIAGRLESCFERADEWIPERWHSQPELVKDARSFLPFAQGRYTCLGKDLAMSELRTVTALLVSRYHIRFPHGADESSKIRVERNMTDQFTATPGKLDLSFICRQV